MFIRMMRNLRCRTPLKSTVASAPYLRLKLKKLDNVVAMIEDAGSWDRRGIILTATFPLLRIIRFADSNQKHMDKVWFLVMKCEEHILAMVPKLNDPQFFPEEYDKVPEIDDDEEDSDVDEDEEPPEYDSEVDSDDEEVDEVEGTQEATAANLGVPLVTFGGKFVAVFLKYKHLLDYPFARCGYVCSVIPDVYEDAKVSPVSSSLVPRNHRWFLGTIVRSSRS